MKTNTNKSIIITICFVVLVTVIYIWYSGSGALLKLGDRGAHYIAFGRLAGLLAQLAILVQVLTMGRISYIEQIFGHNRLNALHRKVGYAFIILIVLHVYLLVLGYANDRVTPFEQYKFFLLNWEHVILAFVAYSIFLVVIIASALMFLWRRYLYEAWYFIHLLVYVAIVLAIPHQIERGDFSANQIAIWFWLILNLGILILLVLHRFIRPIFYSFKFKFRVQKVQLEGPDILSVYLSGKQLEKYMFKSGQFANFTFLSKIAWQPHPYSFSSEPGRERIRITAKREGDYWEKLARVKPGTRVIIDGPLGVFTLDKANRNKLLFIAGGIGITPVISMVRSLKHGSDAVLLYSARTRSDIVFKDELDACTSENYYFITDEDSAREPYLRKFIDLASIEKLVPDFRNRSIYICGPPKMIEDLEATLVKKGVTRDQIHHELFSR